MSIISTLLRFGVNVPVLAEKIYRAEEKDTLGNGDNWELYNQGKVQVAETILTRNIAAKP